MPALNALTQMYYGERFGQQRVPHASWSREFASLREQLKVPSGQRHELCRGIHAEQNAIIQAAFYGVSIKDATLYCTTQPCSICAKMLINAGIRKICYQTGYADAMATEMLAEAGVYVIHLNPSDQEAAE